MHQTNTTLRSSRLRRGWALIVFGVVLSMLWGCTARQLYSGMQQRTRNECVMLPRSQFADCMQQANISYNEYQRLRKEAMSTDWP
jgi:hypothetical protein